MNPERIRIVDVVPGNYQTGRRLSQSPGNYQTGRRLSESSQVQFDVAAKDACDEHASKCLNGGYCVAEGGQPRCNCDTVTLNPIL